MTHQQIAQKLMTALDAGDMETARGLLTDDFQISGPFPEPMSANQWLGIHSSMKAAFPDWSFNLERVDDHGDYATGYYQITGTHEGSLDLSPMGMPVIPATGKKVALPPEHGDFWFKGGKVSRLEVHGSEGGGVPGLLQQLGVEMPG